MKFSAQYNFGFTLIELLVVVSLIAVMTGALVPSFTRFSKNQNLRQAQEKLKSDLRTAQNNALTGAESTSVNYWGIKLTSGNADYTLFNSVDTSDCAAVTETKTFGDLLAGVLVKNTGCIYFEMSSGDVVNNQTVMLGYSGAINDECVGVEISAAGLIRSSTTTTCP